MKGLFNCFNVNVIATGSSGNCTIIDNALALDMGIPFKKVSAYSAFLQVVFISHRHGDHFNESTVKTLSMLRPTLRFCAGEFLAKKLLACGVDRRNIDVLRIGKRYDYGIFAVEPVELHHNVDCYGLKIYKPSGVKALYAVDTGSLDGVDAKGFDLYLVEANHREAELEERAAEKLEAGAFSYESAAAVNHLSWEKASAWLGENMDINGLWIPMHGHDGGNDDGRKTDVYTENH